MLVSAKWGRDKDLYDQGRSQVEALADQDQGDVQWATLTRMPTKAQLYGCETYFREGLADAQKILGDNITAALHHAAVLVIKPDGLACGKATKIVEFLHSHEFSIIGTALTSLSRLQWRELWRYQLSAATVDRLAVNDLIMRDQILVLLLRHAGALDVPATVWLSSLKGPSAVARQPPHCLRRMLEQPNRLFSFLHTANEPADLLREFAVLFDERDRCQFLSKFTGGALSPADGQLLEDVLAISNQAPRPFDAIASKERLERATRGISGIAAETIHSDIARMSRGERIAWRPFAEAVAAAEVKIERWDLAMLGATFIVYDEPGTSKIFGSVDLDAWRRSAESSLPPTETHL